jgi:hypothetical protein
VGVIVSDTGQPDPAPVDGAGVRSCTDMSTCETVQSKTTNQCNPNLKMTCGKPGNGEKPAVKWYINSFLVGKY